MSIGCIVVAYKVNPHSLLKKIKKIYADVDNFYIINNSEKKIKNFKIKKINIINLDVNLGIAAAQNLALNLSYKNKNDYILFSDQDTIFPDNFIKKILNFYLFCQKKYGNIFAVAPNLYDRNKQVLSGFVKRNFFFRSNIFQNENNLKNTNDSKITESMSSGMFINVKKLKKIGFLNENFFLDWVDFDLCWRALKKGYNIIGSRDIVASHFLGSNSVKVLSKSFHLHPPFRSYYIVRNGINLSIYSKNINFLWRMNILLNTLRYSIGYLIFTRPFLKVLGFVILGFAHGFLNILGKVNYD